MSTAMERSPRHPNFDDGNTLSLKHGVYSERAIAERAVEIHGELLTHAPWLAETRYLVQVNRYLQATAREDLAHQALMAGSKLSPRLLQEATAASRLAWKMADELGLSPRGHAVLQQLTAGAVHAEASLADLIATGAEARIAAEARFAREAAKSSQEPLDALPMGDSSPEPGEDQ